MIRRGLKFRHRMVLPTLVLVLAAAVASLVTALVSRQASLELTRVEQVHAPTLEASRDLEALLIRLQQRFAETAATEDAGGLAGGRPDPRPDGAAAGAGPRRRRDGPHAGRSSTARLEDYHRVAREATGAADQA